MQIVFYAGHSLQTKFKQRITAFGSYCYSFTLRIIKPLSSHFMIQSGSLSVNDTVLSV